MERKRACPWKIVAPVVVVAVVVVAVIYYGIQELPARLPVSFYDASKPPQRADAIVILGGDLRSRIPKAVELREEGFSETLVITGADLGQSEALLERFGEDSVLIESEAKSTWENAQFTMPKIQSRISDPKKILLVTNWWHSRRALACFQKAAPNIRFIVVAADTSEETGLGEGSPLQREFLALIWYRIRYGIRPSN